MSEYVVGVDEVGRGSLVGSTIICAFENSLRETIEIVSKDELENKIS